jgi:hypothetical protein
VFAACADARTVAPRTEDADGARDAGAAETSVTTSDATDAAADVNSRWCDTQPAGGLVFCGDFDDGTFGNATANVLRGGQISLDQTAFLSAPSAFLVSTPLVVEASPDASVPEAGSYALHSSFAELLGSSEPTLLHSKFAFAFRIEDAAPPPGTVSQPPTIAWTQVGYMVVDLRAQPGESAESTLSVRVSNGWTGPIDGGSPQATHVELPLATAPLGLKEWVSVDIQSTFTPQPAGDFSARITVELTRSGSTTVVATHDEPSTRVGGPADFIWALGLQTDWYSAPLAVRYDNVVVYKD